MKAPHSRTIFHIMLLASLLATLVGSAAIATPAWADNHDVTSTANAGPGTLRQAVADASPGDTITFSVTGTITLTSAVIIPKNLTISGPGAANLTISGGGTTNVFVIPSSFSVNISGLTIANGFTGSNGGGIFNQNGNLTVSNLTFSNNRASTYGGGIYGNGGTLTVSNCTFTGGNAAYGGGIMLQNAPLTVSNSTFASNTVGSWGGGIFFDGYNNPANTLTVLNSTFSANSANSGGGLYRYSAITATVANSTFSANTATSQGGGLYNSGPGILTLTNSTFSANSAAGGGGGGGGIFNISGLSLVNNILANSPAGNDCVIAGGGLGTVSNNLIETGNCPFTTNLDPMLSALGNNGGSTQTFALIPGSPAIDSGNNAACAAAPINNLDQRGGTRPLDGDGNGSTNCDIGSFEALEPTGTIITADAPDPSVTGQTVSVSVTVAGSASTPGGTVDITGADSNCSISLTAGVGSCDVGFTTSGAKTLTATYNGDVYHSSSQDTESHTVNPADTTTTITADNPDPSTPGQSVTVSFTVVANAPSSGTPTGNLTVSDGVNSCIGTVAAGSCTVNLTTAGLRTLTATYAGDSNFNGSSDTEEHAVDGSPPQVSSITRADANPTNANSVDFLVTFSEPVTGVDTADFELMTSGVSGAAITGISGSNAAYTVTVSTGSGNGTIRLDLVNNDTILDLVSNPLSSGFTGGESYTVVKTAPVVISSVRLDPNPTSASSVNFIVTFSEAVTGVDATDFSLTTSGSLTGVIRDRRGWLRHDVHGDGEHRQRSRHVAPRCG